MKFSFFSYSVGAWRRQKRKEKKALNEYKKMMRDIDEDDWAWTWASALSGSSGNEGRRRRRKNWIARKRMTEKEKEVMEAQVMKGKKRVAIEKERRKKEEAELVERREAQRILKIEELSSAKPVPTPDWFIPSAHEIMQSRAPENPVRKGFNRTVVKKEEKTGRRFGWAKPLLQFKGGALPLGVPCHSNGEKTGSVSPTGQDGNGDAECPPPLEDVELDQPAGGCESLSDEILLSQMEMHDLTLSDTGKDGSLKLKEEGSLSKDRSFHDLKDNFLQSLNSSILLSDKIGLSLSQIDSDDDNLPDQMDYDCDAQCSGAFLQYGDQEDALNEAMEEELARCEGNEGADSDNHVGYDTLIEEMQHSDFEQEAEVNHRIVSLRENSLSSSEDYDDTIGLRLLSNLIEISSAVHACW